MLKKITAVFITVVIAVTGLCVPVSAEGSLDSRYDRKMSQLSSLLEWDMTTRKKAGSLDHPTMFLSVSDGKSKAVTVYSSKKKLSDVVQDVLARAKATGVEPEWLKMDVVTEVTPVSYKEFKESWAGKSGGSMKYGIAFNDYFGRALLEEQINSGGVISYETGELDLKRINTYMKSAKKKKLEEIPETLYLFKTQGYFTDGDSYELINGNRNSVGRREFATDKDGIKQLSAMSSAYLSSICDDDGKFVYGYYPIDNEEIAGYNIIRHGGTVWNLVMQYDMTKNKELIPVIDRAMDYLESSIYYKDSKTAFLAEDNGTLNIGGTGISLLAFTTYAEIFKTDKYNSVIEALANGVIFMQKEDGSYTHSLYKKDLSVHKDYIVIFYDGEATYGLLKAYGVLGSKKFLRAAEKAADYFIANNYEKEHSHWISYTFNELTKYSPKPKYYSFGLKNVDKDYLSTVKRNVSGSPTRAETVGAAFEMYDRMVKSGVTCAEAQGYDAKLLAQAFAYRIEYGLNYFMFPEYAMYFEDPQTVLNSFSIREDLFRIRIDDIQHFMDGYYLYWNNYSKVQKYL